MQMDAIQLNSHDYQRILCIPSLLTNKQTNPACEVCESFDFGSSLQNVYPLLRSVFKYLKFTDLKSAEKVNDMWEKYACEEIAKRNGMSWIALTKLKRRHFILEKSSNFMYDDASFGLVFYMYKHIKLSTFICLHKDREEGNARVSFAEYLTREIVPKGQEFWVLSCRSVYRINVNPSGKLRSVFSSLLIPTIPDVVMRKFCSTKTNLKMALEENLKSDEIVNCLLIFTLSNLEKYVSSLMQEVLRSQAADTIALCGGVIKRGMNLFNQPNKHQIYSTDQMYCLAFAQKRDIPAEFNAFSIVIKEEDDFEEKVSEFKQKTVLREKSFIIRICCEAKPQTDTETALVYKYFPKTSVVGLDVDGEIGWDKFTEAEESSSTEKYGPKKKKSKMLPKTCHQYSTVMALITWGTKL